MQRRTQRLRVLLLSCTLVSVSCNVLPAALPNPTVPAFGLLEHPLPPAVRLSETASIARQLRTRATGLFPTQVERLARVIVSEAAAAGLRPGLVMAVIDVESGARNFSTSPVGARGLMQLLPATGEGIVTAMGDIWGGPETLFDPVLNVRLGVRYLRSLIDRYGDLPTALAAYNWGPGRISDRLRRGEPVPHRYVERVLASYRDARHEI